MRKQLFKKIAVLGLSAIVATTSFTGCGKKDSDNKASNVKEEAQAEELTFADVIKAAVDLNAGEMNGSFSTDVDDTKLIYDWTLLSDGDKGAQLKLTGKTADSKDMDIVVYDNVLYLTADFSTLFGIGGAESISAVSLDLNKIAEQSGVDLSSVMSEDAKNDSKTLIKESIDIIAKAMPSLFGKDLEINEGNAEKIADEFIAFKKSDMRKIYNLFNEFKQKRLQNIENLGDMSEFENSLDEFEKKEVTAEERQELIDELKQTEVKMTADISGEEGSRVFNFTANATANGTEVDGKISIEGKFVEKSSVDIKSLVPENAMALDDYISSMFSSANDMLGE